MENKYVTILPDTDKHLREKCVDVRLPLSKKDKEVMEGLIQYVVDSRDKDLAEQYGLQAASGLAAPQIGVNRNMIVVVMDEEDEEGNVEQVVTALVNPKIVSYSKQYSYLSSGEGCLSVPEAHEGYVPRHARITVEAYDYLAKKKVKIRAKGYYAIVLQHEIDHLSGILYYDHINKNNPYAEISGAIVID